MSIQIHIADANGEAAARGTVGPAVGTDTNTYTATVSGLTGSPQTFSASATAAATPTQTLVVLPGQSYVPGVSTLAEAVTGSRRHVHAH